MKLFATGRKKLGSELDVLQFLRRLRTVQDTLSLKIPLTKAERQYLAANSLEKLYASDSDSSGDENPADQYRQ